MPGPHSPLGGLVSLLQPFGRQGRRHAQAASGPPPSPGAAPPNAHAGQRDERLPVGRARKATPALTPAPTSRSPRAGEEPEDYFSYQPAPAPTQSPPANFVASPLSPPAPLVASPPPLPTPGFGPPPPNGPAPQEGAVPSRPPRPPTPLEPALTQVTASSAKETASVGAAKTSASRALSGPLPRRSGRKLQWDRRPLSLLGPGLPPPKPAPQPPTLDELRLFVAQVRQVASQPLRQQPAHHVLEEVELMELLGVRAYVARLVDSGNHRASFRSLLAGIDEALRAVALGVQAAGIGAEDLDEGQPEDQLVALAEVRYAAWCRPEGEVPRDADVRADHLLHANLNVALHCTGSSPDGVDARAGHEAVAAAGIASYRLLLRLRSVVHEGVEPMRRVRLGGELPLHLVPTHGPHQLARPLQRLEAELGHLAFQLRAQHESVASLRHALQRQLGGDPLQDQPLQLTRPLWLPCPVVAGRQHRVAGSFAAFRLATLYELLTNVTEGCLAEVQRVADALREAKAEPGHPAPTDGTASATASGRLPAPVTPVSRPKPRYVPPPAEERYGPVQPRSPRVR